MTPCQQADLFVVPLLDGSHGLGQVIVAPQDRGSKFYWPAGAAFCLLTLRRATADMSAPPVGKSEIISFSWIDAAIVGTDLWPIIGFEQLPRANALADPDSIALLGDITPTDAPIIEAFLNAYHGLFHWDGFPDTAFFDQMLASGVKRPTSATFSKGTPK